jgi:hypothetical protein
VAKGQAVNSNIIEPETAMLYRVLDESFECIVAARPSLDTAMKEDLRIRLAQLIRGAFERGEVDPVILKQIAVGRLAPAPEDIG